MANRLDRLFLFLALVLACCIVVHCEANQRDQSTRPMSADAMRNAIETIQTLVEALYDCRSRNDPADLEREHAARYFADAYELVMSAYSPRCKDMTQERAYQLHTLQIVSDGASADISDD